jgi:hypothetical protein
MQNLKFDVTRDFEDKMLVQRFMLVNTFFSFKLSPLDIGTDLYTKLNTVSLLSFLEQQFQNKLIKSAAHKQRKPL